MSGSGSHRRLAPLYHGLASFSVTAALLVACSSRADAQSKEPDHVVLGAGVAATPAFQGADAYRIIPLPVIDIKKGWLFANLRNGAGLAPVETDHVTVGISAVFIQGYRRQDVPVGIDHLSDGVGARVFANLRTGRLLTTVGATKGIAGGTGGTTIDVSTSYTLALSSRFVLAPSIGTTWADRKHNDRYFGITATESAASGLPRFAAGSGFKDASASLTARYRLTDRIALSVTGVVLTLLGSVSDSPKVEAETRPAGFFTASYRL